MEYQSYDFRSVDQPLSPGDRAALRAISGRADINLHQFCVDYDWGDLRADPANLLERYFDQFIYDSNFGFRRIGLRLPAAGLDDLAGWVIPETPHHESHLDIHTTGNGRHIIIWAHVETDQAGVVDQVNPHGDEPADAVTSARQLLLAGDLAPLCILWLAVAYANELAADTEIPTSTRCDGRRQARDLDTLRRYVGLPQEWMAAARAGGFGQLSTLGRLRADATLQRDAAEVRRQAQTAAERAARLRNVVRDHGGTEATWAAVTAHVLAKTRRHYAQAIELLDALEHVAEQDGTSTDFARRLHVLRSTYESRPALIELLDRRH